MALAVFAGVVVAILFSADLSISRPWEANRGILLRNALHHSTDDGFYYLEIARNVARGVGSTFDGINRTNGYHPLWMLSLVPVFWIADDPTLAFLLATLLEAALFVLSCIVLTRTLRLAHGWPVTVVATLVWVRIQASHWVVFEGLEYALQTLLLCAAGYFFIRDFSDKPPASDGPYLRLGVILALCFLARLENGILASVVIAAVVASLPASRPRMRYALLLAAPLLVVSSSFALVNAWMFGHPLPVSGAVKAARSAWLLKADLAASAGGYLAAKMRHATSLMTRFNLSFRLPLLFGLSVPLLILALGRTSARTGIPDAIVRNARAWRPFVAFAWIHLALLILVFHGTESYKPWYFVAPIWLAVMTGASLLEWLDCAPASAFDRARRAVLPVLAALVVAATLLNLGRWRLAQREAAAYAPLLEEAAWLRDNLPPSAVAAAWNTGIVGYFSQRTVVNLDGLTNSWEYFRRHRFDLCRYWEEAGIDFLVDMFPLEGELVYMNEEYARWSDIRSCAGRLEIVWRGTAGESWAPRAIRVGTQR